MSSGVSGGILRVHCVHEQSHEDAPVAARIVSRTRSQRMQAVATSSVALSMEAEFLRVGAVRNLANAGNKLKSDV